MERARLFFIDNNVHIATALSFAAMPACYLVPHVAKLLSATHGLNYPSTRMAATGQFTVYLMQPDAFESGSRSSPQRRRSACCTPRSVTTSRARTAGTSERRECRSVRRT